MSRRPTRPTRSTAPAATTSHGAGLPVPPVSSASPASSASSVPPASLRSAAAAAVPGRQQLLHFADAVDGLVPEASVAAPVPELHLVTFQLDREEFGIPIGQAREVVRVGDLTRVPEAPPHIRGVVNLRGRVLPVVEIRSRLGLSPLDPGSKARIVVVESTGRTLGLLVDSVNQMLKVRADAVLPPPTDVLSASTDYVTGVAHVGPRLVILLDLDRVLLLAEGS